MKKILGILFCLFGVGSVSGQFLGDSIEVEIIGSGSGFFEGPVWRGDSLVFSAISSSIIYEWKEGGSLTPLIQPSGNANGLLYDQQGRLLMARHGQRDVARRSADGSVEALASTYQGHRLNSPNDLALYSDGSVFFTDPTHGLTNILDAELDFTGVYSITPDGELVLLDGSLENPNGIAFSPDYSKLYVDITGGEVYCFDVERNNHITNKRLLLSDPDFEYCDGMSVDSLGFLYVANAMGISVIDPGTGTVVRSIPIKNAANESIHPTNCCFGGPDGRTLYVTSNHPTTYHGTVSRVTGKQVTIHTIVAELSQLDPSLLAFPNPFYETLNIPLSPTSGSEVTCTVYRMDGTEVAQLQAQSSGWLNWDTTGLPEGNYLVVTHTPEGNRWVQQVSKL